MARVWAPVAGTLAMSVLARTVLVGVPPISTSRISSSKSAPASLEKSTTDALVSCPERFATNVCASRGPVCPPSTPPTRQRASVVVTGPGAAGGVGGGEVDSPLFFFFLRLPLRFLFLSESCFFFLASTQPG